MPHKFILGQAVGYTPPAGLYAPPGIYGSLFQIQQLDQLEHVGGRAKTNSSLLSVVLSDQPRIKRLM
jgi:hypothetical protein